MRWIALARPPAIGLLAMPLVALATPRGPADAPVAPAALAEDAAGVARGADQPAADQPAADQPAAALSAASAVARLARAAPDLDPQVLARALDSARCARQAGALPEDGPPVLAVIDYSLPSTQPRLWVLDLERGALLLQALVAHGQGSGEDLAVAFSNRDGSHQTSLGLYRAAERYRGQHGLSLRLDGLDEGLNDRARQRAIVVHGADYATQDFIERHGRLGRSWGCPAVAPELVDELVGLLEGGAAVYAWSAAAPELDGSRWRSCPAG